MAASAALGRKRCLPREPRPKVRTPRVHLVPMQPSISGRPQHTNATFGQRRLPQPGHSRLTSKEQETEDATMEMSWVPSSSNGGTQRGLDPSTSKSPSGMTGRKKGKRKGMETFGAGLEKGIEEVVEVTESERIGRTQRRKGGRSGSKNA